jgi:hypothetical protein
MPTIGGLPTQSGGLDGTEEFPAERVGLTFKFTINELAAFIAPLVVPLDIDALPTQSGALPAAAKIPVSVGGTELQFTVQDILNLTGGSFDIDALPAQSGPLPADALIPVSIGGTELRFTVQDVLDLAGYQGLPQNSQSTAYTCVLSDAGKHILHPSADTTARTFTIPANSSVAYSIGTTLTFVNQNGAGDITIAITTDTMRLAGAGTTGSRTLTANGIATALKLTATEWLISGTNLA